jgi:DNA anti-recombination protein RmuC
MADQPGDPYQKALSRLAAHDLSELDRRLITAFGRLAQGQAAVTDGALTVTNLCAEAGVSRASYYRSPVAASVKELLASPSTHRPEVDRLRDEVRQLRKDGKELRRRHAEQVRELKATIAAYANQIQVLALASANLQTDNQRLLAQLARSEPEVIPLTDRLDG